MIVFGLQLLIFSGALIFVLIQLVGNVTGN